MNYNDFPILSNEEYNLMNQHFNNEHTTDRKTQVDKIFSLLDSAYNICVGLSNKHNFKITKSITTFSQTILKVKNNFTATFNLNTNSNKTVFNYTIFKLLDKIFDIIHELNIWISFEEKTYYKTLAQKSLKEIIIESKQILLSLNNSNVLFFKHM